MTYNERKNLSSNSEDIEALWIEIINAKSLQHTINTSSRQPAGWYNESEIYLKQFLCKSKNKMFYFVDSLNLNLLDYRTNIKVKYYLNLTFL